MSMPVSAAHWTPRPDTPTAAVHDPLALASEIRANNNAIDRTETTVPRRNPGQGKSSPSGAQTGNTASGRIDFSAPSWLAVLTIAATADEFASPIRTPDVPASR